MNICTNADSVASVVGAASLGAALMLAIILALRLYADDTDTTGGPRNA